jgi:hypothetical protein
MAPQNGQIAGETEAVVWHNYLTEVNRAGYIGEAEYVKTVIDRQDGGGR